MEVYGGRIITAENLQNRKPFDVQSDDGQNVTSGSCLY